jgi:hypothetical protein
VLLTPALGATLGALPNVVGDYKDNGIVDADDCTVWRDSLGSTTNLAADGDACAVDECCDRLVFPKCRFA